MKRSEVAAALRAAQAGSIEEQRLALVRLKVARARVNAAKSGRITGASPAASVGTLARNVAAMIAASQGGRR